MKRFEKERNELALDLAAIKKSKDQVDVEIESLKNDKDVLVKQIEDVLQVMIDSGIRNSG